jgi:hypothetical protein
MHNSRVVSEADYAALFRIFGQKFFRPKNLILRPSCESVSAKAMNEDNTRKARQSAIRYERSLGSPLPNLLYLRILAVISHREAILCHFDFSFNCLFE